MKTKWAVCPRCRKSAIARQEEAVRVAEESYGKVTAPEYLLLLEQAKSVASVEPEETLREECEIGTAPNGTFSVSYSCHCDKCGLLYHFEHEQEVPCGKVTSSD